MRYTQVELEGRTGNFAVLSRKRGSVSIEVEIIKPDACPTTKVNAADPAALKQMAEKLRDALDGPSGDADGLDAYAHALTLLCE